MLHSRHQGTVGLSLDQAQLAQINQLMSDLNKTTAQTTSTPQQDETTTLATVSSVDFQQQQLLDLLGTSPLVYQTSQQQQQHIQISPIALSKLISGSFKTCFYLLVLILSNKKYGNRW